MVAFDVESGIPLPAKRRGPSSASNAYRFAELVDVGKSFFVAPDDGESIPSLQRKVSSRATQYARDHAGLRFATRVAEKEVEREGAKVVLRGVRVWRTA